ncbi:MAG: hypothetical protein GTN49_07225 [candidate division Zixibacteria bacterium]|nr:hypothetical protein [candidate division Zixibacteria bacterium]
MTRQVETEEYVWYTAGRTDAWIYKARVSFTRVAPASLGRVKALYR